MRNSDNSPKNNFSILFMDTSHQQQFQKIQHTQNTSHDKSVNSNNLSRNNSCDNSDSGAELDSHRSSVFKNDSNTSSKSIPKLSLTKPNSVSSVANSGPHTPHPPTYHPSDPQEEFYSLCFQKYQPLAFYSGLVEKVLAFGKAFDEGSPASREVVWKHLYSLMGIPFNSSDLGAPLSGFINQWLQAETVNLFLLEVLYIAFMCATGGRSDPGLRVTENNSDKEKPDPKDDDDQITMYTPWGCNVPAVLCQLMLLQHWLSKFEKLSSAHKKAIWNTCKLVHVFSNYNEGSFKLTFQQWAANPLINLMNISVFFSAVGFLRECGILKYDFCYPKTTSPVFEVNAELSGIVSQQHIQLGMLSSDSPRATMLQEESPTTRKRKHEEPSPVPVPQPQAHYEVHERMQALVAMTLRNRTPPSPQLIPSHNNNNNLLISNMSFPPSASALNFIRAAETMAALSSHTTPSDNHIIHPYRRNSKVDLTTLVTARRLSQSGQDPPASHSPHTHQGSGIMEVQGSGSFHHKMSNNHTTRVHITQQFVMTNPPLDVSDSDDFPSPHQAQGPATDAPSPQRRRSAELREQTVKKMSIQSLIS